MLTNVYNIITYPDDVNPVEIGLSKIVTDSYGQRGSVAASTVERLIRLYMSHPSLHKHEGYPDGKRSLAQFLRDNLPACLIDKFIVVLGHWIDTKGRSSKILDSVEQFVSELENLGSTEGCGTPGGLWSLGHQEYGEVILS